MSEQTTDGLNQETTPSTPEERPAAEAKEVDPLALELDKARQELARVQAEGQATTRRLDEIARAYSALLSDQKDFRSRLEREKERVLQTERGKTALPLLQISDEMERALNSCTDKTSALAQGVRLIHEGLMRTLTGMGIERISVIGRPFDPVMAEAVDLVMVSDPALDSQVMEEAMPGYRLGDRVLRPARVRVARHVPLAPAAKASPEESDQPDSKNESSPPASN